MSDTIDEKTSAEGVSSLPSAEPIESSPAAAQTPSSTPPKKPSGGIASLLANAPSKTDAFLAHLHRIASSRSGADVVLFFLCYSSRLSASLLETGSRAALRNSANKLVSLALQLPPSTAVSFKTASPIASPVISIALQLSSRLRALSGALSEVRTFGRLWGLLGLYFAAKKYILTQRAKRQKSANEDKLSDAAAESRFDDIISGLQILSLISFQALENVAFLSSKKVLGFSPATQGKLAQWSVRSWSSYVFMELTRLAVERQRRVASSGGRLTAKDAEWSKQWKTNFFSNLAWSPITVHWSMDDGPLSDLAISLLAIVPAITAMRDTWIATA